jgi:anti-anti-sigma factor
MALTVTSRIEDSFAVLELSGTLTLGPTLSILREYARTALSTPAKVQGIVLRVADISMTDSSGLGELMMVYTLTANRNCGIRLAEVPAHLRRMLEMTRLEELLPSSADISAAKRELKER